MASPRRVRLLVPALGLLAAPAALSQTQVQALKGSALYESLGWACTSLGDVDGDGVADFAVSAPSHHTLSTLPGRVRVHSGASLSPLWTVTGTVAKGDYGYALADVGDLDGDGVHDLLVGAPDLVSGGGHAPTGTAGSAELLSGASGASLRQHVGDVPGDMFGSAVAGLGDVNGDGVGDYAVGAPGDDDGGDGAGAVRVFSGSTGSELYTVHGSLAKASLGASLAEVGDVDGDGVDELLAGAPGYGAGSAGAAFLLSGDDGVTQYVWFGPENDASLGVSVAGLGDVDGDGVPDVGIGAPEADAAGVGISAGAIYAYSGATKGQHFVRYGDQASAYLGRSVAGIADVSGDGVPDVVVGSSVTKEQGTYSGHVRVLDGATGAELGRAYGGDFEYLGTSVAALGDLDGDGLPEFAAGGIDGNQNQKGILRVFSTGLPMPPSSYCTGKVSSQGCTPVLTAQGTPTVSGPDDFVVVADQVINNKPGMMLWSLGAAATWSFNATLCLASPVQRTPFSLSGGNPGGDDCSGALAFAFTHAYLAQHGLVPGTLVHAQAWYRDPALQYNKAGFSQALAFFVAP